MYFYPGTTFGSIEKRGEEKPTCDREKRQNFNIVKKRELGSQQNIKKGLEKCH
jgi:hypothetical protein